MSIDPWNIVDRLRLLDPGEIQLWRIDLLDDSIPLDTFAACLSNEERDKAAKRRPGRVRAEFVIGRACLRVLLGTLLGASPAAVSLRETGYGKPELTEDAGVAFNVTHTRGVILLALSRGRTVGVDAEYIDPQMNFMELSASVLSGVESERLEALPTADARRMLFYRTWTRKEAVIKADGRGLSLPLTELELPMEVEQNCSILHAGKCYFLNDIAISSQIVGAVVSESPNCRITRQYFPLSVLSGDPVQR